MPKISPKLLVNLLRGEELRIRTGVLLLASEFYGFESEIAVHLTISHQNICTRILEQASPSTKLLGITKNFIFDVIDSIIADERISGRCILISGIDYLLAALSPDEIKHFWDFIRDNYRRNRGIIVSFPKNARALIPLDEIKRWNDIDRLTFWEGHSDL